MSATQRYKVRPYRMKAHEVMVSRGGTMEMLPWRNSAQWLIPPRPLGVSKFCFLEVVGLDVSSATV